MPPKQNPNHKLTQTHKGHKTKIQNTLKPQSNSRSPKSKVTLHKAQKNAEMPGARITNHSHKYRKPLPSKQSRQTLPAVNQRQPRKSNGTRHNHHIMRQTPKPTWFPEIHILYQPSIKPTCHGSKTTIPHPQYTHHKFQQQPHNLSAPSDTTKPQNMHNPNTPKNKTSEVPNVAQLAQVDVASHAPPELSYPHCLCIKSSSQPQAILTTCNKPKRKNLGAKVRPIDELTPPCSKHRKLALASIKSHPRNQNHIHTMPKPLAKTPDSPTLPMQTSK
eukprot:gene3262-2244_t